MGFFALALTGLGVLLGEQAFVAEQLFPPLVQQRVGVVLGGVEVALEEVQVLGQQFREQAASVFSRRPAALTSRPSNLRALTGWEMQPDRGLLRTRFSATII